MNKKNTFIALLRGINVGGHHKVPMADLRKEMATIGFENIITILNSGNVIFDAASDSKTLVEEKLENHLEKTFGFAIPVVIVKGSFFSNLIEKDPFQHIEVTQKTRLYVTFLKEAPEINLTLPWTAEDGSFKILEVSDRMIFSVLDLSATKTPKGMDSLEKMFGKNITTRNWKTVQRIVNKLNR